MQSPGTARSGIHLSTQVHHRPLIVNAHVLQVFSMLCNVMAHRHQPAASSEEDSPAGSPTHGTTSATVAFRCIVISVSGETQNNVAFIGLIAACPKRCHIFTPHRGHVGGPPVADSALCQGAAPPARWQSDRHCHDQQAAAVWRGAWAPTISSLAVHLLAAGLAVALLAAAPTAARCSSYLRGLLERFAVDSRGVCVLQRRRCASGFQLLRWFVRT